MLVIRSVESGRVLGFAKDTTVAASMAQTNGWRNWVAEEDHLELVPEDQDPRNRQGARAHAQAG